ncbi:MAG: lysine biosynthesis protein LysW [Halobacteriota archaeon]
MTDATCSECGATIDLLDEPLLGQLVDCTTCGAELEVTAVDPIEVRPAPDLAEDWGE